MFSLNAGTTEKRIVPDIAQHVRMNGCAGSAKSPESNVPNAQTKHSSKSPMMSSVVKNFILFAHSGVFSY